MGIILRCDQSGEISFYMKGADTVMCSIVQYNDWLEEEVDNMAREGLRTLVVAKKTLTLEQYQDFEVNIQKHAFLFFSHSLSLLVRVFVTIFFYIPSATSQFRQTVRRQPFRPSVRCD